MAIAAFRYCCGRMSYIVSDCADWLVSIWPELSYNAKEVIQRDLEHEFKKDDVIRLTGDQHKPLGMDCDRKEWERVRKLWT